MTDPRALTPASAGEQGGTTATRHLSEETGFGLTKTGCRGLSFAHRISPVCVANISHLLAPKNWICLIQNERRLAAALTQGEEAS